MAVVTDDFNRANGALGSNWTSPVGSFGSGATGAEGTLQIASNVVKAATDDTHSFALWAANSFVNDQYAQITIGAVVGNNWMGVICRAEFGLDRYYVAFPFGVDYRIYRRWDGVYEQLATTTGGPTLASGDIIKLEVTGSVHPITGKMYRNGTLLLTWTSPSSAYVKTGGNAGMGIYSPAGWNLRIDNFEGGGATPNIPPGLTSISSGVVGQYQKHFA